MSVTKKTATQAVAPIADATTETGVSRADQFPSYFIEKLNRRTGELEMVPKFKYLEGMPKEYRFDGRIGTFGPVSGGGVNKLKVRPIAYRFFEDQLLGQTDRKLWGEIFFVDETDAVSSILFHTHSLRNLQEVIAPLFYEDMMLEDVVLLCSSEKMETKKWIDGKESSITYFLAKFDFEEAPIADVDERIAFANTVRIYRRQTLTENAVTSASQRFFDPFLHAPTDDADEAETTAEVEL